MGRECQEPKTPKARVMQQNSRWGLGTPSSLVYLTSECNCKKGVPMLASTCVSLVLAVSAIPVGKWDNREHGLNLARRSRSPDSELFTFHCTEILV